MHSRGAVSLPSGLVYHCDACKLVTPEDAPRPDGADCDFVARNKLTWFNPNATVKGQHTMAVAAWSVIHHKALQEGHEESRAYFQQFQKEPRAHFQNSAMHKALTAEQIAEQVKLKNGQDKWAYATEEV